VGRYTPIRNQRPTVPLEFSPTASGISTATLNIASSDPDESQRRRPDQGYG